MGQCGYGFVLIADKNGAKMVKVQEMDLDAANGNGQFPGEKAFEDREVVVTDVCYGGD